MPYPARLGVFAPILVSLWYLVKLRHEAALFGTRLVVFWLWFVVAFVTQMFARTAGVWLAGLLAQVALAIVLVLKQKVDEIY